MSTSHYQFLAAAHLLFIRDGKILLSRRFNTGYEDGNYGVVSGHLDGGETICQAALREAREEAGLSLNLEDISVVHLMHRNKGFEERMDFFVIVKHWSSEPMNTEPDKCDDLAWFSLDGLPTNTISYIKQAIEYVKDGVAFSEFGFDVATNGSE